MDWCLSGSLENGNIFIGDRITDTLSLLANIDELKSGLLFATSNIGSGMGSETKDYNQLRISSVGVCVGVRMKPESNY